MRARAIVATLLLLGGVAEATQPAPTACTGCHLDPEWFGDGTTELRALLSEDVHAAVGLSCQDCHGGNPAAPATDLDAAMDPGFAPDPYRGVPARADVPAFCGRCHSDPEYMKRFDPAARVDQVREYWTSDHGKELTRGNDRVATCVDCHGAHGIRRVDDRRSSVHALHVSATCASCHADAEHMEGATRADGSPLPIDQYARWRESVHGQALLVRGDLSAPTCNDCHGNHGATPPGVESLALVCGRCHAREASLFRDSGKREGFHAHNELYLADAGGDCGSCHAGPEPQARLPRIRRFSECAACHRNHAIVRPTLASLSPLPAFPCAFCHQEPGSVEDPVPELEAVRRRYAETRQRLIAQSGGLAGDELFDWLVGRALTLPAHRVGGEAAEGGAGGPSPAFSRLFERFRIGKTHFTYDDPKTGAPRRERVIACSDCHAAEPVLGDGRGHRAAAEQMRRMRELTTATARAERVLLRAQRGGVRVQEAELRLDRAVDAQIQLEALVHAFHVDGAFASTHEEGLAHARAALEGGKAGLAELGARRRGLAVALVLIVLVLVGLGLKIRRLGDAV